METNLVNTKLVIVKKFCQFLDPSLYPGSIVLSFCQDLLKVVQRLLESVSTFARISVPCLGIGVISAVFQTSGNVEAKRAVLY